MREVDILVDVQASGYSVLIGIECCDRSRPATVEWVEQICRKHTSLPTDKLVLVSSAGYTKNALRKAQANGAEALTISEAADVEWTSIVHKTPVVLVDAVEVVTALYPLVEPDLSDPDHQPLDWDSLLISNDGQYRVPVEQFINTLLAQKPLEDHWLRTLPMEGNGGYFFTVSAATGTQVVNSTGTHSEITSLTLAVVTRRRTTRVPLKRAAFREAQIAYGEGAGDFGPVLVAIVEREGEPPRGLMYRQKGGWEQIVPLDQRWRATVKVAPDDAFRALLGGNPGAP